MVNSVTLVSIAEGISIIATDALIIFPVLSRATMGLSSETICVLS